MGPQAGTANVLLSPACKFLDCPALCRGRNSASQPATIAIPSQLRMSQHTAHRPVTLAANQSTRISWRRGGTIAGE